MLNSLMRSGLGPVIGLALLLFQAAGVQAQSTAVPMAVFPEKNHQFSPVLEGVEVKHDFIIENRGGAPLDIKKVQPD
jgi:hypothetical protein